VVKRLTVSTWAREVRAVGVDGKVVLVTGASRGIGAATTLELARGGANVVAGSRDVARLADVRRKSEGLAGEVATVALDVCRDEDVERAVALAASRFGRLDALVNNAAVGALGRVEEQTTSDWLNVVDTNVVGTLRCCRAAIPRIATAGGGTIVNISSAAAADGFPRLAAYSASKAAIAALTLSLRREVKDRRIRVSTVRIHHVMSEFLGAYDAEQIAAATEEWMKEGLLAMTPLISPVRIAEAIAFLIGLPPEASVHDIDVRALGA